ncbi:MAG: NUDIX hydrolase [Synergistetes bacterium]|nr:NUDIX hydrolase [Synergistota bacterium]
MSNQEETVRSEVIFSGKILNLRVDEVTLPNGRVTSREIIEHRGAVAVVPVKRDKIVLVRQYRKAVEEELLEIPAGTIEKGESPVECARRELVEEVGLYPLELKEVFRFYSSPGFCNEILYLYFCDKFEQRSVQTDEDEFLDIEEIPLLDVSRLLDEGVFKDSKTLIGMLYLKSVGLA